MGLKLLTGCRLTLGVTQTMAGKYLYFWSGRRNTLWLS